MSLRFEEVIHRLRESLKGPLPGAEAHEPLRATAIGDIKPNFVHSVPPKPGSVLILLYPEDGRIKFPLTKRPEYLGAHSGQVSFPGGKAEQGETIEQTALREGEEEIGIHPSSVEIIGKLSDFFVIPSNFMISPVVGFQRSKPYFIPDPVEVAKVLEGSVEDLVREDAVSVKDIIAGRIYNLRAPHFTVENEIVWGATAMILNELRMIVRGFR
ncbi:MAG: CoA pyrophosphatase [Cytophagales bacterium]|nr:CoA pyrophosphatase [Cytophagales bacterium]